MLLGLTQETAAKTMRLTFQQLQKYEYGRNRISASRLYQLSLILDTPISVFFQTIFAEMGGSPEPVHEMFEAVADANQIPADITMKRTTIHLVRAFYAIDDENQRNAALNLLKAIAHSKNSRYRCISDD
jgi:transcriptional regulator with XRE-family HTH domain